MADDPKNQVKLTVKPKRPISAYIMWLNATREQIKSENPGLKQTELAKKAGELWRTVDKSVWEEKAAEPVEQYKKDLKAYYAHISGVTENIKNKVNSIGVPKRPLSAFKIWLNASREQIKSENPGLKGTELAKKGKEIWRALDKSEWHEKAVKAREQYGKDLERYYAHASNVTTKLKKGKIMVPPKRPMSAYMMWLNASRKKIKSKNPGLSQTELAKKGGELWKALDKKDVWEKKADQAKEQYGKDLKEYHQNIK